MSCKIKERSISYAVVVSIPTVDLVDKDKVFKECCYIHTVLADKESDDKAKNDFVSFYHQKELSGEIADFKLLDLNRGDEYELTDDTFGSFHDFGSFEDNTAFGGFVLQWKKVLEQLGEGNYKIAKTVKKIGITVTEISINYSLRQFSDSLADKTIRIDVVLNGKMVKTKDDFSGLNWVNSIRVGGFFGRRDFQMEEDVLISGKFENQQISMHQTNEYKLQTNLIPNCVTKPIIDLFLFADYIYMNDYNLNNHNYSYKDFLVRFKGNDSTNYFTHSRRARLNLTFSDKIEDNWKRNYR